MAADKDFFISYTGTDQAWAEWIAETLEQAGHTTVLQAWDFRPGENFIQRMNEALAAAERVLAVLSPAYFHSEYTRDEWTAALVRGRGQADRLLPVRIAPCELPPLLAHRIYVDLVGLQEQAATERLVSSIQPGRARPVGKPIFPGAGSPEAVGAARFPGRRPPIFNVPPRNPNFTGRSELLQTLRRQLAEAAMSAVIQAEAIYGLGGVGKTQLAIEYAHRFAADYDLVWWIPAEQSLSIRGWLAGLARRLHVPELPSLEEQVAALFDELGQRDRWLLIYDNATEPADLDGLRPPAGPGHLLITSRNPVWRGLAASVGVDVLRRGEAVAFLRQGGVEEEAAALLAEELGDLPLALEQAAAYMEATSTPPTEYLSLLRERAAELLALGEPSNTEQTIATTWSVSLERVREQSPVAEDLLRLCSFLAPDDMPRSLFTDHADVLPEPLGTAVCDRLGFPQALGALRRYSLITVTGDALGLHRLVQAVVRHSLRPEGQRQWAATAVGLVLAAFPDQPDDIAGWPATARLLPHALAASDHASGLDSNPEPTGRLLNRTAAYLQRRAQFTQTKPLLTRAVAMLEEALGPHHPAVAASLDNLGNTLFALRELPPARQAHERALAIRRDVLGSDHLETARSLNDLGNALRGVGEFRAARAHYERALAIRQTKLGPDHPETAMSLDNLGLALHGLGELPAARQAHHRALAIRREVLGPDHPETARSLNNLGLALHALGELSAARASYEHALAIRRAQLGPDNPHTAGSMDNLGAVLRDLGDLQQARALHERALAIRRAYLGPDHPHVARSLDNLALVLHAQGDLRGAQGLHERALAVREARLGPDHPTTAHSLKNLAIVVADQGDLAAARSLHERALTIRKAQLGLDHPDTVGSRQALAAVVAELDNQT